jgi:hypothetical protein
MWHDSVFLLCMCGVPCVYLCSVLSVVYASFLAYRSHLKVVAGCTHASKVVDGEVSKVGHECVENSCSYYLGCMAKSSFVLCNPSEQ